MFNLSGALVFLFGLSLRSSVASGVAGSLVDAGGGSEGKSEGGTGGTSGVDSRSTSGVDSRSTSGDGSDCGHPPRWDASDDGVRPGVAAGWRKDFFSP